MKNSIPSQFQLTRLIFQRSLAFIYLIGFLIILRQYLPLLGENGLYPIRFFIEKVSFYRAPSLFFINHSDGAFLVMGWVGLVLSLMALTGFSEAYASWFSSLIWALLWVIYLSFVNLGQAFYGFGWESILLETGFLAIFLGSAKTEPPKIIFWLLRWVLFRIMFGAGLIKLRADPCWRDLTCMVYHYETQPIPNPLSWFFHRFPLWVHKGEVLFTHFVELIIPWGYFLLRPLCYIAGVLTVLFQFILILSGNLSWLNYMTIVLCIPCFDDRFFRFFLRINIPEFKPAGIFRKIVIALLTTLILILSINPALNLLSKSQMMNASFDSLHIVNTYGAFGSITRKRMEIDTSKGRSQGKPHREATP